MYKNGNITLVGEIRGLKPQRRADDPGINELREGLVWVNSTDKALRWYDGTQIHTVASGGSLDDYLSKEGGVLTGALTLSGDATDDLHAVPKRQVETMLEAKQDNITGAATSILSADLTGDRVLLSNEAGKVAVAEVTATELSYLSGVTENVQNQIDSKQADLGYTPVNKAGDTVTGLVMFTGQGGLTGLPAPVNPTDPVRLVDIDYLKADLDFQADVLAIQTDDTLIAPGEEFEGPEHTLRYIINNIASLDPSFGTIEGLENGDIIQRVGGEWTLAYDVSEKGPGVLVWSRADEKFVKYDGTNWTEHGGLSGVTATGGLSKDGNVIRVNTGAGVTLLPEGEVGLDLKANNGLQLVDPSTGEASTAANSVLALRFSESELTLGLEGLTIADAGVAAVHLNADVAGNGLQGGAGSALSIKAADTSLVVDGTGIKVGDLSEVYLSLTAGGEVSGDLAVKAPVQEGHAANKGYVDGEIQTVNQGLTAVNQRLVDSQFVFDALDVVAQDAYSINHNLGNRAVSVAVYDEDYKMIVPDSVELVSENTVNVTLAVAQRVYIVIHGVKAIASQG